MSDYIITHDGELMHYGVLGMKWGKRRAQTYSNKARSSRLSAKEWDEISKNKVAKQLKKGNQAKADKIKARYEKYRKQDLADAKRYEKKSKDIENKHIQLAGGKKVYDYTTKQSLGKNLVKSYLLGTYGALKYNQARVQNASRGKAAIKGALYDSGNSATGGILGIVEPRLDKKKK